VVEFFLWDATNPERRDRPILMTRLPGITTSRHAVSLPTPATTFGLRQPFISHACRTVAASAWESVEMLGKLVQR